MQFYTIVQFEDPETLSQDALSLNLELSSVPERWIRPRTSRAPEPHSAAEGIVFIDARAQKTWDISRPDFVMNFRPR